jgi:uncharacterized membrane protein
MPNDERKPLRHHQNCVASQTCTHVVLVHFPIALFAAAVAFDYLAQWNLYQNTDC